MSELGNFYTCFSVHELYVVSDETREYVELEVYKFISAPTKSKSRLSWLAAYIEPHEVKRVNWNDFMELYDKVVTSE